jgi:hypothetical protein
VGPSMAPQQAFGFVCFDSRLRVLFQILHSALKGD